jgi:hypothetical protein
VAGEWKAANDWVSWPFHSGALVAESKLIMFDELRFPGANTEASEAIQPAMDLTAERPIRDIARTHEAVINVPADAAVPMTASLTRDCIFKVDIAVALAHDFPRKWCADPKE